MKYRCRSQPLLLLLPERSGTVCESSSGGVVCTGLQFINYCFVSIFSALRYVPQKKYCVFHAGGSVVNGYMAVLNLPDMGVSKIFENGK